MIDCRASDWIESSVSEPTRSDVFFVHTFTFFVATSMVNDAARRFTDVDEPLEEPATDLAGEDMVQDARTTSEWKWL